MITIKYDCVLLVYTCTLAISWIIFETSKYLVLFELSLLLGLLSICEWKWKKKNKERKK